MFVVVSSVAKSTLHFFLFSLSHNFFISNKKEKRKRMTKKKKVVIDELIEQEKELTMKEWLQIKINDTFIEYIPLDTIKQMPTNYKYIFGSFAHIFSFTVLIGFLIWGIFILLYIICLFYFTLFTLF